MLPIEKVAVDHQRESRCQGAKMKAEETHCSTLSEIKRRQQDKQREGQVS